MATIVSLRWQRVRRVGPCESGELSTRSDEFRTRWGAHNVRHHGTGTKRFHHHAVGDLTLASEGLEMAAEPGLTLTICTVEPGSPSEEGLRLLASWAATQDALTPARRPQETRATTALGARSGGRMAGPVAAGPDHLAPWRLKTGSRPAGSSTPGHA